MKTFIGADLGTSSLKLLLMDEQGNILNRVSESYPIFYPHSGWSEQNPKDWWCAFKKGVKKLVAEFDAKSVCGIGVGGQMHGLVILDDANEVIRPAILWNDGRTFKETEYLNNVIGEEKLKSYTGNIAFAGFTSPKILWLKENEPENFNKISKIMLPKDYVNYKLTGIFSTDFSDASGMLLLDVKNKCWSKQMLDICKICEKQLPQLFESFQSVGTLLPEVAAELGLGENVFVAAGAGDNAAAAVGMNTVSNNKCNISLGTSGTIFVSTDSFKEFKNNAIHNFCHSNGNYHLMACILSAASCNKWFYEDILKTDDYFAEQRPISDALLGENTVYFLPYLMGERSPKNDVDASGTFIGIRPDTSRSQMVLSILEGVAFALKENFEIFKESGVFIDEVVLCGGGAKSELWQKIIANVLGVNVVITQNEEGPALGGAILSMIASNKKNNLETVCNSFHKVKKVVHPQKELTKKYADRYNKFKIVYPALKETYKKLNEVT